MIKQMGKLVDGWTPGEEQAVFRTDGEQESAQGSSDYFLDSADRIHFFAEPGAVDEKGGLKPNVRKAESLNKAGHGLHVLDPVFKEYSTSAKVKELVNKLGWRDAVLPQSMYIFKQPRIGGEVTSHQDSTFLYTTPRQSCLGMWLALHDATLENGCLWVRPGSHNEHVRRQFHRNSKHFDEGDTDAPQMLFRGDCSDEDSSKAAAPWEGAMPDGSWPPPCEGLFAAGFVPVECKAGDLVCFPGTLDHLSLPNLSASPRHTYQLHLVEGPNEGVTWSSENWLQYKEGVASVPTFPSLSVAKKD
jgi:phytanoyl-CoA hydroxylase